MIENSLKEFTEDLSWLNADNPEPIISIYGMLKNGRSDLSLEKGIFSDCVRKISCARLSDESQDWPVIIHVFDVYVNKDITSLKSYKEIIQYYLLSILKQGALLSWCMFEGGFMTINNLFTDWEINSTYAFCLPNNVPQFALERAERNSKEWRDKITALTNYIKSVNR